MKQQASCLQCAHQFLLRYPPKAKGKTLRTRLHRLRRDQKCSQPNSARHEYPIFELLVGNSEIRLFLNSIKGGGRTWYNYARLLKTLFRYAQANRYYPKNVDPFEGIDIEYENDGEVEIFTPEELQKLLGSAKQDLLPFLVIGAFAGLRHAEICRLDWADVKQEHIEVKKGNAKTRSRRLVPIQPNLAQWIALLRKDSGLVVPYANMGNQLVKLISACKKCVGSPQQGKKALNWKHNGLRHSFVNYRIALVQNENQIAMEAGNSPAMIHQHYRELVTAEQAKEWFSIVPEASSRIVQFSEDENSGNKRTLLADGVSRYSLQKHATFV